MSAFSSILRNPADTDYDGKDKDEQIVLVLRRSSLTNVPWMVTAFIFAFFPFLADPLLESVRLAGEPLLETPFIGAATLFWYLFTFGYFFTCFTNWYFNVLIVTNKKIVDMDFHGITYKNISETVLTSVEDVTSNISGPIGTIFNIGHIFIQTAAEKREFEFHDISDPSGIRDTIADLVAAARSHKDHAAN